MYTPSSTSGRCRQTRECGLKPMLTDARLTEYIGALARLNVHKDRAQPFCSPQDHIHCGILFLTRQLRNLGQHEREQCLREVWEWARRRADLLSLEMIRGYRSAADGAGRPTCVTGLGTE